jgi:hypothetical protein
LTEAYDGYTYKECNKNSKKFQKVAILFCNGRTSKPYSHTQQMKVWENTEELHRKKLKLWVDEIKLIVQQENLTYCIIFKKDHSQ